MGILEILEEVGGTKHSLGGAAVVLNGEVAAMSYCPHPGDNRGSFLAREPSHVSCPCSMASKGRALAKGVSAGTGPSPWGFHGARCRMSSTGQRAPPISQVLFDNEAQVNSATWVGAIEFLKKKSPVKSLSINKLNRELIGADPSKLTLSDVGISLLECLI